MVSIFQWSTATFAITFPLRRQQVVYQQARRYSKVSSSSTTSTTLQQQRTNYYYLPPPTAWARRCRLFSSSNNNNNNNNNNNDDDLEFLESILVVAEDASRRAGAIMMDTLGRIEASTKENTRDLVTESDVACQQTIRETVLKAFPHHSFLGEEDVAPGSQASVQALQEALQANNNNDTNNDTNKKYLWVVDPIDGTTNFQAGLPICCVSIGVVELSSSSSEPRIVVGVVYNPVLNERLSAVCGVDGVRLNGQPLDNNNNNNNNNNKKVLSEAVINVGFPVLRESTLRVSAKAIGVLATRVRGIRMMACAAQVMAWVAQDKLQTYLSWDVNAWDACAGLLLVQQAGGYTLDLSQDQPPQDATLTTRDVLVCSPGVSREYGTNLQQLLRDHDCIDYE